MNNLKQLETREVTVGENIFYIRPLPAFKAANMTGELAALVLPLVSGLAPLLSDVDTEKEGDGLLDIKVEDAAPAIAGAFSSLDGDKVEKILKHLLIAGSNISVEQPGEKVRLLTEDLANEVFCTDVQDMYAWHISDLKIYDQPKSLSGFSRHDFRGMNGTDVCGNESCEHYQPSGSYMLPPTCAINGCCLSKPPQSWCYVAEAKEDDAL